MVSQALIRRRSRRGYGQLPMAGPPQKPWMPASGELAPEAGPDVLVKAHTTCAVYAISDTAPSWPVTTPPVGSRYCWGRAA